MNNAVNRLRYGELNQTLCMFLNIRKRCTSDNKIWCIERKNDKRNPNRSIWCAIDCKKTENEKKSLTGEAPKDLLVVQRPTERMEEDGALAAQHGRKTRSKDEDEDADGPTPNLVLKSKRRVWMLRHLLLRDIYPWSVPWNSIGSTPNSYPGSPVRAYEARTTGKPLNISLANVSIFSNNN